MLWQEAVRTMFFVCSPSMVQADHNSGSGDDTTNILPFQSRTTGTTRTTPEKKRTQLRTTGDGTTTGSDKYIGFVVLIFALLAANTFFLITEQSGLYTAFGYTEEQSWFIAILSDLCLLCYPGVNTHNTPSLEIGLAWSLCDNDICCGECSRFVSTTSRRQDCTTD